MIRLKFNTQIHATPEKVWEALWEEENYNEWTKEFDANSRAVSDWKEGSKILFLGSEGHGMYSRIERKVKNELMTFKHLGVVKDGQEQPMDAETQSWSGSLETYNLQKKDGYTELLVEMDTLEDYADHFKEKFPKALSRVRAIAERI